MRKSGVRHVKYLKLRTFRGTTGRSSSKPLSLHPGNARPLLAGSVGVLLGLLIAVLVRSGLEFVGWLAPAETESLFAGFVTAGVAGGAAGLTYTNLLYKRAESARGERAMHEDTLRVAAELVGSEEELTVISGAKLLAGLIEMSPTHAQTAADILCARLRRGFDPSVDTEELELYSDETRMRFEADRRMRNAVAESIASVTHKDSIAPHVLGLRWSFTDVEFGGKAVFDGCVFGDETSFVRTKFGQEVSFRGAWFLGPIRFESACAPWGINMRACHAEQGLDIVGSQISTMVDGLGWGLVLDKAELGWLRIEDVRSLGPILLGEVKVVGDILVTHTSAERLSLYGEQCDSMIVLQGVTTTGDLTVRQWDVRKGVAVSACDVGGELQITDIRTDGSIVQEGNTYNSLRVDF